MGVTPLKFFFKIFFVRDIGVTKPPKKPNFFVYGPILKILSLSLRVGGGGVSAGGRDPPTPPKKIFFFLIFFFYFLVRDIGVTP